jgi:hypothetical protein
MHFLLLLRGGTREGHMTVCDLVEVVNTRGAHDTDMMQQDLI